MSARLKIFCFFWILLSTTGLAQTLLINSPSTVCAGSDFSVSATHSGTTAVSYSWSVSGPVILQTSSGGTCSVSSSTCGMAVISCSVFSPANNLLLQASSVCTVICPSHSISPASTTLCGSGTVSLTASGSSSYSWSTGATGTSYAVSPTVSTVYAVYAAGSSCPALSTVVVQNISISASTASLCPAGGLTLTASAADSYNWFQSPGVFMNGGNAAQVSTQPAVLPATYTVFAFFNSGCIRSASVTIQAYDYLPRVSGPSSVCPGASLALAGLSASSYTWSSGTQTISAANYSINTFFSPATFTLRADSAGCAGQRSVAVGLFIPPNVQISSLTNTVCNGQTASLFASGAVNYTWTNAAGLLSSLYGASVIAAPISTTIYTVTGSSAQNCTNTATLPVYFANYPSVSLYTNVAAVCPGYSATAIGQGAVSYFWRGSGLTGIISGYSVGLPAGIYTMTGSNGGGCKDSLSFIIGALAPLDVRIAASSSVTCLDESGYVYPVSLLATGAPAYSWQALPAFPGGTAAGFNIFVSPSVSACYTVTGYSSSCHGTASVCVLSGQICTQVKESVSEKKLTILYDESLSVIRISGAEELVLITLSDLSGRILLQRYIVTPASLIDLSLQELTAGYYQLSCQGLRTLQHFLVIRP